MATLNIFAQQDQELPITTMAELKASIPVMPERSSLYALDLGHETIQIVYGSPDQGCAEVKRFTNTGIEREAFDTFNAATERFFALAQAAL